MSKARLSELNNQMTKTEDGPSKQPVKDQSAIEKKKNPGANPVRGERGDFAKVTITMHPDMISNLKLLGMKRKRNGAKDTDVSSLVREAVTALLEKQG